MKNTVKSILLASAISVVGAFSAWADDIALVISNDRSLSKDTEDVAEAYQRDGFRVLLNEARSASRLTRALSSFEAQSRDADRVVIHYVGELATTENSVSLQLSNSPSRSIVERYFEMPSVELLYDLLEHRPGRSALVIASTSGRVSDALRQGAEIPNGLSVIVGPGGSMNWIIRELYLGRGESAKMIDQRNDVDVLGFRPDYALASVGNSPRVSSGDSASRQAVREMGDWRAAAQSGTVEALQSYLRAYPNGLFVGEANARINTLRPPEMVAEDALKLNRNERRSIQRALTVLGFDTRGIDGVFGAGTRNAVKRWQQSVGIKPSGYVDASQIRRLTEAAQAKAQEDKAKRDADDLAAWRASGSGSDERGVRNYLAQFPQGLFAAQAKDALSRFEANKNSAQNKAYEERETSLRLNAQTRNLAEQRLAGLGYKVGRVDGQFTAETRQAIAQFQQKEGLPSTGYLDNPTVTKLVASLFR